MTSTTKIVLAILGGAAMIALALYLRPIPDRYDFRQGGGLARLDKVTGEMMACSYGSCVRIDRNGKWIKTEESPAPSPTATVYTTDKPVRSGEELLKEALGPNARTQAPTLDELINDTESNP